MNKQTLRIAALCAGLTLSSFTGLSFAADDVPAKLGARDDYAPDNAYVAAPPPT